jgi:hypothetical protein
MTVNASKKEAQRGAVYSRGGDMPMHGKGDRTRAATADAAGEQTPGRTSQKSKTNPPAAEGGSSRRMFPRQAAEPAMAGKTGKKETAAGSKRASGGLDEVGGAARPAKPGQTGC